MSTRFWTSLPRLDDRRAFSQGPANTRSRVPNPDVPRLYVLRDIRGESFSPVKHGGAAVNRKRFVAVGVGMILAFGVAPLTGARVVGEAEPAQAVRLAGGQFGGWIDAIHRAEGS